MSSDINIKGLTEYLGSYITDHKKNRINEVLNFRTRYITLVLEDIYQPQNASAVIRTADCLGLQEIHIIESRNEYRLNPDVTLGSSKWIDLVRFNSENKNNTIECIDYLKQKNYKVIGTSPDPKYKSLNEFEIPGKTALLFGTELEGLTKEAIQNTDDMARIPMYGFTESYNISVSAAICMYLLVHKLRRSNTRWQLSQKEKEDIRLHWYRKVLKNSQALEQEFVRANQ